MTWQKVFERWTAEIQEHRKFGVFQFLICGSSEPAITLTYSPASRNSAEPQCLLRGCKVDSSSSAVSSVEFSIPLLFLFLCACELACVCLHMNVCVFAHVCPCMWMNVQTQTWRSEVKVGCLLYCRLRYYLLQGLSLTPESLVLQSQLLSKALGSSCFCFYSAEKVSPGLCGNELFIRVPGIWTWVLMLALLIKAFLQPSPSPNKTRKEGRKVEGRGKPNLLNIQEKSLHFLKNQYCFLDTI